MEHSPGLCRPHGNRHRCAKWHPLKACWELSLYNGMKVLTGFHHSALCWWWCYGPWPPASVILVGPVCPDAPVLLHSSWLTAGVACTQLYELLRMAVFTSSIVSGFYLSSPRFFLLLAYTCQEMFMNTKDMKHSFICRVQENSLTDIAKR